MKIYGIYPTFSSNEGAITPNFESCAGLEYVLAYAIKHGHSVKLFDTSMQSTINDAIQEALDYAPDIIAVSLDTCLFNFGAIIVEALKANLLNLIAIAGGAHTLIGTVERPFDFYVIGEGEVTFLEILNAIEDGQNYTEVLGISFFNNGIPETTARRPLISDLDDLPYPYRDARLLRAKNESFILPAPSAQRSYVTITASRGCKYSCSFCNASEIWGQGVIRHRTIDNVIKEIKHVKSEYNTNLIFFNDLNFTANALWVQHFCEKLIEQKVCVNWVCMSNICTAEDPDILRIMKKAGCVKIMWGVESVSPNSLTDLRKPNTFPQTKRVLKASEEAGIINHGFYIIGTPSDDICNLKESLDVMASLPLHSIRIAIDTPIPGSVDYTILKTELPTEWSLYDTNRLIYSHRFLDNEQVKEMQDYLFYGFYSSKIYIARLSEFIAANPHLKSSYEQFQHRYIPLAQKLN